MPPPDQDASQQEQFFGDGQWHYDERGAPFYFDEVGNKNYY